MVCCVFFAAELSPPCRVFQLKGSAAPSATTQRRLEERYCRQGAFITCPLYQRVDSSLYRANQAGGRAPRRGGDAAGPAGED